MRAERNMYEKVDRNCQHFMTCNEKDDIEDFFEKMGEFIGQQNDALRLAFKSKIIN